MDKPKTEKPFGTNIMPTNNGDQGVARINSAIKHPGKPVKKDGFKKLIGQ